MPLKYWHLQKINDWMKSRINSIYEKEPLGIWTPGKLYHHHILIAVHWISPFHPISIQSCFIFCISKYAKDPHFHFLKPDAIKQSVRVNGEPCIVKVSTLIKEKAFQKKQWNHLKFSLAFGNTSGHANLKSSDNSVDMMGFAIQNANLIYLLIFRKGGVIAPSNMPKMNSKNVHRCNFSFNWVIADSKLLLFSNPSQF